LGRNDSDLEELDDLENFGNAEEFREDEDKR
jgi:hypothetical protein